MGIGPHGRSPLGVGSRLRENAAGGSGQSSSGDLKAEANAELFASIERALEHFRDSAKFSVPQQVAATRLAGLTVRQRQIMELVLAGHPSKNIAADLSISQRTVENHRAAVMKKTGSHSLSALIRLALAADPSTAPRALS